MQHRYKTDLFVVGGQGRLLTERAIGVLVPKSVFDISQVSSGKRFLDIADKIGVYSAQGGDAAVAAAMTKLRKFGNRTDHDDTDDLEPKDKPDVIACAFVVAKAVFAKV